MLSRTVSRELHRNRLGQLDPRAEQLQCLLLQRQMRSKLHEESALIVDLQISKDRHTVLQP